MVSESQIPKGRSSSVPCAAWHLTFGSLCLNCGEQHHPLPGGKSLDDSSDVLLEELEKRYYENPLL